jgi:hypothetical protein
MLQYICSTVKSLIISKKGYGRVNERGKLSNFTLTWFGFMVFNTTFKNISVISWTSVLLVEETRENHQPITSHWKTLSHNVVSNIPRLSGFELTTLIVVGTDCIGSSKSNYHTITATTDPFYTCKQIKINDWFFLITILHFSRSRVFLQSGC